jgi:hypothetical protein
VFVFCRENFPKHIVERKLGKFCNVPLATPPQFGLLPSPSNPNFADQVLEEKEAEEERSEEESLEVPIEPKIESSVPQSEMQLLLFPQLEIKYEISIIFFMSDISMMMIFQARECQLHGILFVARAADAAAHCAAGQ